MIDKDMMDRVFELARESTPTHPNPRVGAIVLDADGNVAGEGNHAGPGHDHAEVVALKAAGGSAKNSTVYVSLEPCNHHGRTGPCTEALIEAGVGSVIVGIVDPDPRASSQGVKRLQEAGIRVVVADDQKKARQADPAYFHHRETGMPMVTIKWAMTLDGSIAAADGSSQWITSDQARQVSHEMRARSDAVVVGAGTLRLDDPLLTARTPAYEGWPQPTPVVIAGAEPLPIDRQLWSRNPFVVSTEKIALPGGVPIVVSGEDGRPDPTETCLALADLGLLHLLLEGGPTVAASWWNDGVVTNGSVWIGSKVGGGLGMAPLAGTFANIADADVVSIESVRNVGNDVLVTFEKK